MRKRPLLWFYLLAFGISWLGWVPQTLQARGLFPVWNPLLGILAMLLGGVGPTLAAVIVTLALKGRRGPGELFAPLGRLRAGWAWYLAAFLGMPGLVCLAFGVGMIFGQPFPDLGGFAWAGFPVLFLGMLFSNVWEEIGWRGFALPRLQEKHSALMTSLIMGLLWSLWHLPLMLDPSNPMSGLAWAGEIFFSIGLTVIYTWLYNNTAGSLFFVTVFHAMSNAVAAVLLDRGLYESSYLAVVAMTVLAALIVIVEYGPKKFIRR